MPAGRRQLPGAQHRHPGGAVDQRADHQVAGEPAVFALVGSVADIPVIRPMMVETVALGAAYAAGPAVGYWSDQEVLREFWRKAGEWKPSMSPEHRDVARARWRHAVEVARLWGRRPV